MDPLTIRRQIIFPCPKVFLESPQYTKAKIFTFMEIFTFTFKNELLNDLKRHNDLERLNLALCPI